MAQVTKEQIEAWKAQHGEIFKLDVDGREAYLKKPDRKTLSYGSIAAQKDPMKFNEILLKNCWLGGDEEIMTNDTLFVSAGQVIAGLIEIKKAELVKL